MRPHIYICARVGGGFSCTIYGRDFALLGSAATRRNSRALAVLKAVKNLLDKRR